MDPATEKLRQENEQLRELLAEWVAWYNAMCQRTIRLEERTRKVIES